MNHDELPIKFSKRQILYALDNNNVVIVTAETGSGKTTQIPQYLIEAGYTIGDKCIAITVPRRIAAVSISKRISEEMGCYNSEIAYNVRFDSTVNQNTRVIFLTDGMLVQQLYSDPLLSKYSVIMLDDIHEKSINFQILFGFLKKILRKRKDLKLLLTSATIQVKKLQAFFTKKEDYREEEENRVCLVNVPGRTHEVKINYLRQPTSNYFLKIFQTIVYIDRQVRTGNILVFLTSVEEIQGMINMLDSYTYESKRRLKIIPLHASLPMSKQSQIFQYVRQRKIILSTNIAESSITIPDVKYVIDCGYVKIKAYDHEKGVQKMIVVPCGKSAAIQRTGRAGRVFDGQCYRIYTQNAYIKMQQKVLPQLLRIDISHFLLKLMGLGIKDILGFEMTDKPEQKNFISAIDILNGYELIDEDFNLTQKGTKAAQLSLDIKLASMLLNSFDDRFGCSKQILMLVSMLQVQRDIFTNNSLAMLKAKKKIGSKEGDFLTLINIFLRYSKAKSKDQKRICSELKLNHSTMEQALKIHDQLLAQIKSFRRYKSTQQEMEDKYGEVKKTKYELKSSSDEYEAILRCILTGYFVNIAQLQGEYYMNIRSKEKLQIHPTSILSAVYPEWIIYHEVVKSSAYFIHNGSRIETDWIFELAGHYYKDKRKEQAEQKFNKEREIDRPQIVPERATQQKALVQVGGKKAKPEPFKTSNLGLKNKSFKKSKLSFEEQI